MRLIDVDALGIGKCNPDVFNDKTYANGWNSAIDMLQNAPTVDDVVEVRHGHWENAKGEFRDCGRGIVFIISATCSVCGRQVNEAYWKGNPPKKTPYCPHCGAKMDESEFAKDINVLNRNESEGE